jgi:prepilin-type N-terminal cleavage/methylation domain-containing protein
MAQVKHPNRSAFTLLELLVVIAIVVVLAGLLFPAVQSVLERAKKVQAKNDLTQIVTAINAYYTEYGKFPFVPATGEKALNSSDEADLFYTLRAIGTSGGANANNALNTRQIVFMTPPNVKDTSNPRSGIGSDGQFFDPWGTPYQVAFDSTYDTNIDNPYQPNSGAGPDEIRQNALAWSLGRDKKLGNAGDSKFTGSDDVISWQ